MERDTHREIMIGKVVVSLDVWFMPASSTGIYLKTADIATHYQRT